ncbi:hypothetical protein [Actinomadura xylanilytica]|uniref:hypothetical protein n=1 Tax=Actinomadura xylanilytica TaxID=887459 RepID=UPI0032E447BB
MGVVSTDEVFFREWSGRGPGEGRSVRRARQLAAALDVLSPRAPVLTVVGSKGKGTTATYASAVLSAAGLRVCTVTSPGYRSNRDRIRIDGEAVTEAELRSLGERLGQAMDALPADRPDGYLSPSGLFILAGVLHARRVRADVLVLEAGMGGRSDEVSLFPPDVVAIAPIFGEHLGVLGGSVTEIAEEKAAVVAPGTRAVLSARQPGPVADVLATTVRGIAGIGIEHPPQAPAEPPALPRTATGPPTGPLPDGLSRTGAELGAAAARRLLDLAGRPAPAPERLRAVLASVRLPGRLSWHTVPGTETELLADSAIDREGISAALSAALSRWGALDHVLICLPDHKDLDGAITALRGLPVTYVRLPHDHLRFTRPLPAGWRVLDSGALTAESVGGLGRRVAAFGTVYFIGLVLDLVDAGTERLYE